MAVSSNLIAVLDYGMGNLHSVSKALQHVAPDDRVVVTEDVSIVQQADRLVFPGVGAIRDCMAEINNRGFGELIKLALPEKPVLGICVGMQALMDHSEENNGVDCLGILPGRVRFFGHNHKDAQGQSLKVPHMGWNTVQQRGEHPLWGNIAQDSRFYFVHSYYVDPGSIDSTSVDETSDHQHGEWLAATCQYGVEFAAALSLGNLFAVQFHPEKSHAAGLQLLKNFTQWQGV